MYDLVIIGSGPAGMSAALYAERAMLKTVVIEKNSYSGGQIVYTDKVDNYLGIPNINGFDLSEKFRKHIEAQNVEILEREIEKIIDKGVYKEIKFDNDEVIKTKTIIIATGTKHRKLNVKGEEEFQGLGVSYCAVCDGAFFKNKNVAVIGGGDVAIEDAIYLSNICKNVYLIHRRDKLKGAKILQDKLFKINNITFIENTVVKSIEGNKVVEKIIVENIKENKEDKINVDGVFIAIGIEPEVSVVSNFNFFNNDGYIIAGEDGITSVSGIFAAGDVRTKNLRQIITAVSDGANCVSSVEKYLYYYNL